MYGKYFGVFRDRSHFLRIFLIIVALNANAARKLYKISPESTRLTEKIVEGDFEGTSMKGHFFQDIFAEQMSPLKLQFGHVCENPSHWQQRFEEKDLANNRHRGKVSWGNKDGAYGEQYWDINHR